jgi:hypothetical protein
MGLANNVRNNKDTLNQLKNGKKLNLNLAILAAFILQTIKVLIVLNK